MGLRQQIYNDEYAFCKRKHYAFLCVSMHKIVYIFDFQYV